MLKKYGTAKNSGLFKGAGGDSRIVAESDSIVSDIVNEGRAPQRRFQNKLKALNKGWQTIGCGVSGLCSAVEVADWVKGASLGDIKNAYEQTAEIAKSNPEAMAAAATLLLACKGKCNGLLDESKDEIAKLRARTPSRDARQEWTGST